MNAIEHLKKHGYTGEQGMYCVIIYTYYKVSTTTTTSMGVATLSALNL
jgi:hypothetical protein